MGDLATAMIQCRIDSLCKIIECHAGLETHFKDHLEEMKEHLGVTRSYLVDSATLQSKEVVLKTPLKLLKELVYEADDLLTYCCLRYENTKKLLFLKYYMAKKLRDVNSRLKDIEAMLAKYFISSSNPEGNDRRMLPWRGMNHWSEMIGLEEDVRKMANWILLHRENDLNRIGIVGVGGLGKTTVAERVFYNWDVFSHLEKRIWLSASLAFDAKGMLCSILNQLGERVSGLDESEMLHKIQELLRDKSYLIVLDDVWDTGLEWCRKLCSEMPIPRDDSKSSCIIVTTRNEDIAIGIGVNPDRIHEPKVLDRDHSWSLFCQHAFPESRGECPNTHLENIGRKIVEKCGGLPLAIKTVGAFLAWKTSPCEWVEVEQKFRQDFNPIMASLQLSYAQLPCYLKQCLSSFAIYPKDAKIEAEQVIFWWAGEGLIQVNKHSSTTALEYGYMFLSELAQRCLIHVMSSRGHDGRILTFKLHDLVRTQITLMAEEEGFCSFNEKESLKLTVDRSRWLGLQDPIDQYSMYFMKKIAHLKLRALLLVPSGHNKPDINNMLEVQLKSLRVLDISHSKTKLSDNVALKKFWAWITSLERLAYLNLSGLADLIVLPSSIKKLLNLQILVLRECINLTQLHSSVTKLKHLIVFDVRYCPRLLNMPRGLQNLSNIQELSGFRISNKSFSRLINLVNLRVLRIIVHEESVVSNEAEELSALSRLNKLRVLSISCDDHINSDWKLPEVGFKGQHVMNMLDHISPPPALKDLYLQNYRRENLWSWINPDELSSLQYLCIEYGNLVSLSSSSSRNIWKIEGLCLKHLGRLQEKWETLKEIMPLMHYLEVSHCIGLQGTPGSGDSYIWRKDEY